MVSATSCSCPAGQQGLICMHRACVLAQVGEPPLEKVTGGTLPDLWRMWADI